MSARCITVPDAYRLQSRITSPVRSPFVFPEFLRTTTPRFHPKSALTILSEEPAPRAARKTPHLSSSLTIYSSKNSTNSSSPACLRIPVMSLYAREGAQFSVYVPSQLLGQRPWIVHLKERKGVRMGGKERRKEGRVTSRLGRLGALYPCKPDIPNQLTLFHQRVS